MRIQCTVTQFTDLRGDTHKITHVFLEAAAAEEAQRERIEELCRVFAPSALRDASDAQHGPHV